MSATFGTTAAGTTAASTTSSEKTGFAANTRPTTPAIVTATSGRPPSVKSPEEPAAKSLPTGEKGEDGDNNGTVQDEAPNGSPGYLAGISLFTVMSGITVVMMLAMLDITIISTAIPQITSDFNRLEDVGWYVGAYQLASATIQPLTGKVYTYFSTKWTYLGFFFLFELGSVICGAATSSTMLIIGRAIAGMGSSGLFNGTLTIVAGAVTPGKRPLYNGIAFGVAQIGIIAGPILGGVFTQYSTWRWCFWLNLPLGGIAAVFLVFVTIRDQTPKSKITFSFLHSLLPRFDLPGFALFAPASIMFLLALQFGSSEYGWGSSEVIGLFCGAAATLAVFLAWEWRMGDDAMIPLGLVARRIMWCSSLTSAFLMSNNIVAGTFFPIYLQSVRGLNPLTSGLYLLPSVASQIFFVVLSGALMTRLRYYIPWAALAAVGSAVSMGLMSTWDAASTLGEVFGFLVLSGVRGVGMQVPIVAIQNNLPPAEIAIGSSILIFIQNLLAAVFVVVGNTLFQQALVDNIRENVPSVDPESAIAAGGSAEAVRALVPTEELPAILDAYAVAVSHAIYLMIATSICAFATCFGMGWVDLRESAAKKSEETGTGTDAAVSKEAV